MADRADNFDRSNGVLNGSTPSDGGSAWTAVNYSVTSNRVECTALGYAYEYAFLDAGSAAGEVAVTLAVKGQSIGPALRSGGSNSYYVAFVVGGNQLQLYKRTSSTTITQIGTTWSGTISAGDVIKLGVDSSNNFTVYQNGTARIGPVTDAFNSSATQTGFVCYSNSAAARLDDWSFTDAAGGASINVTLIDAATPSDVASASATRAAVLTDAAASIDLLSSIAERAATLTDSATALDVLSATRIANVAALEAAAAVDQVNSGSTVNAQVQEAASTADALGAAATLVVQLLEAGSALDQLNAAPQLVALLTESAAGGDLVSAASPQVYSVTALELAAALDVIHAWIVGAASFTAESRARLGGRSLSRLQPRLGSLQQFVSAKRIGPRKL